jgi:hypothetical protein
VTTSRRFHLSDILSITHDRLFSTRHMDGVYDICNFLTNDKLFTHQLPRVHDECKSHLLALYPQLNELPLLSDSDVEELKASGGKEWWQPWLDAQIARFGEHLEVAPITLGIHQYTDPIAEAIEMVGKDKVIVVRPEEEA